MIDNTKKRILIFSTAYLPFIGGAEVAVKEITDRIPGIEFVMLTARLDKKLSPVERVGNIGVHRLGEGSNRDKYRLMWQGARYAQNLGHFDAIWAIMASYAGFAALRYKKRQNRPFLLTLQEGDSRWQIYKHVWWCWPYFKQIFKRADKIQAISNYLAEWARKMGARCPVEVVPNGIGMEHVTCNMEHRREPTKRVITVSRLVEKNGVADLIKAIKILDEDNGLEVVLKILGDGKLRRKLENIVDDLKMRDNVEFEGEIFHEEVYERLKQADVFCRPSLSEGLGNAFLEAMSIGVPVIATPVGGIPDFLEDPSAIRQAHSAEPSRSTGSWQAQTGWFCKVKDPESIAEKIRYILDEKNKEEVSRVVENAKKLVEEKYSWDLIASKMRNIFESL